MRAYRVAAAPRGWAASVTRPSSDVEIAGYRHRLLLRTCRERQNRHRVANERDDLAAAHAQNTGEAPAVILIGARCSSAS